MVSMLERISGRRLLAAGCATVALAAPALAPGNAPAGQYHVYSCRTPSGESAPTDGWSPSKTGTYAYAEDTCSQPDGALLAALGDQPTRTANTDIATWAFAAPMNATIANATLWRAGDADGEAAANAFYEFWFSGPENNIANPVDNFGQCEGGSQCLSGLGFASQPLAALNRVVVPNPNLGSHLYVNASCVGASGYECTTGKGDANGYAAAVYVYAADITLEQDAGPSASGVSGELASAPSVRGVSDVAFSATDPGSGVYEAVFSVDGRVVQASVLDANGGRCREVGQSADGLPAFLYVQPCEPSVSVDVPFETTSASDGAHHLIVSVIDAAGNAAPVLDREITVANPPAPGVPGPANGTNASAQAALSVRWRSTPRESLTSAFGRAQTIMGRLTAPGGTPISGAAIDLRATPAYAGARTAAMASPRTAPDGRFSVRLPGGVSSRTLRFAYRSHLGDALPVATRTLTLRVRAGIALTVAPRTTSVGGSIYFRGRLRGGPIPSAGKQLVLEARSPGSGWIEFDVVRTDTRGRYRASYRFKFPGPASYSFRVLSEPESDYPFAGGSSNVVGVREEG
jgi:hypothetical protein